MDTDAFESVATEGGQGPLRCEQPAMRVSTDTVAY